MKSLMILGFLLSAIFLFPGCYTVVFMEPTDEVVFFSPGPIMPPEPWPVPAPPPGPLPPPHPHPEPPIYLPPVGHTPVATTTSPYVHRPMQTGRGPINSNPVPVRNDENKRPTRSPETQKGRR